MQSGTGNGNVAGSGAGAADLGRGWRRDPFSPAQRVHLDRLEQGPFHAVLKAVAAIYTNGAAEEIGAERIVQLICGRWGEENAIKELLRKPLINYTPGYVLEELEEQPLGGNPQVRELRTETATQGSKMLPGPSQAAPDVVVWHLWKGNEPLHVTNSAGGKHVSKREKNYWRHGRTEAPGANGGCGSWVGGVFGPGAGRQGGRCDACRPGDSRGAAISKTGGQRGFPRHGLFLGARLLGASRAAVALGAGPLGGPPPSQCPLGAGTLEQDAQRLGLDARALGLSAIHA